MFRFVAALLVLPALIQAQMEYTVCTDGGVLPNWATIKGCTTNPCQFVIGQPITLSGELTTDTDSKDLTTEMTAFVIGVGISIDLPEDIRDGCQLVGCPLPFGKTVTFDVTADIPIPDIAAGLTVPVEMMVTNENKERVICLRTNLAVVRG